MPLVGRNDLCRQEATDIVGQLELAEFSRILAKSSREQNERLAYTTV